MKIIRLTALLDFGGQERKYILFSEKPSLLKHDYIFSAIGHGGHAEKLIKERGFEVKIFNQNPAISNIRNIWMLYKWFKKEKPDIVHTAAAEANFHGVIAAKLAGVPYVIAEEIGFPNHSGKAKIVFKYVYRLVSKVVCVSKAVKEFLIQIGEIKEPKGIVIYNPVGDVAIKQRQLTDVFTIVCVGRLEKVKNQQLLVRAFSEMTNKKSKLIIVGDGRERENLEQLIKELGLQDRIEITGFTPNPEQYLQKANLFVLPSLSEGFGIAVVEAMLQKVPCLCSKVGGIPEFIEEGKTGWLFDPLQESELVTKLNQCANMDHEAMEMIGENGYHSIENAFTVENYVQQLESLYEAKKQ
ncbi:glycosyltransferase [Flavobacterium terrisoli]|uniref:glycosyltransferase n=1 Tax=Flavobacterium terrisoli TaxID=3242195 RepID=UPI002543D209|nr:glycosyltransferase [Flavobacterium buctense]